MIIVSWGLEGRGKLQKRRKKVHQEKEIMSKGAEVKNWLMSIQKARNRLECWVIEST